MIPRVSAVIVDDDAHGRNMVRLYVERYFAEQIDIIAEAYSIESAVNTIRATNPQLLFLDIDLNNGTGFEVLDILGEDRHAVHVVFVTSYPEHLRRALRYDAIDYLDKPIIASEFKVGIERAIKKIYSTVEARAALEANSIRAVKETIMQEPTSSMQIEKAHQQPDSSAGQDRMQNGITIRNQSGNHYMLFGRDILYCRAAGNYVDFFLTDGRTITDSKTLKHYEPLLEELGCIRISRALVVNPLYITLQAKQGIGLFAIMPKGETENVEPQYRESVQRLLSA